MNRAGDKNIRDHRSALGLVINLLLTVIPAWIFYWAYRRYYPDATFWYQGNQLFVVFYCFVLVLFMMVYSGYKVRQFRTRELIFSFALASAITNFIMFFVMCLIARHMLKPWGVLLTTFVQWIAGLGVYILARITLPKAEPPIPVLYIREDAGAVQDFDSKFDSRRSRYSVAGSVSCRLCWEDLKTAMEPYRAVLIGDMPREVRHEIVSYCFTTGRNALMIPDMGDVVLCSATPMVMGDSLIYDLKTRGEEITYRVLKRAFDIFASLLGLILLSPVMLAVAVAVKRQDGGPAIFRQTRLTQGGKQFQLMKFRSMVVDAESVTGAVLAGKNDDRITRVGRFIRATRLDELPQLWNILKGDMSIVGPRPERPEFYETICAEYPEFEYRLKVKAGLTGYAQLYGKYNTTFAEKAKLDVYYIQHASLLWDLQLIFYTLKIIFIKESTEGVDAPTPEKEPEEAVK